MTLAELIGPLESELEVVQKRGSLDVEVGDLTDDSRLIKPGTLFVAVRGGQVDGHAFVTPAVGSGAMGLVVERDCGPLTGAAGRPDQPLSSLPVLQVKNSRRALGLLAGLFHGDPSSRLEVIGVTGTNGKTTVCYLIKAILERAGRRIGLIGTVAYHIGAERLRALHTTPQAVEFQGLLARMVDAGLDGVVMEVSSHALSLDRTVGCEFDVAVYTNLTQDHLDFHADLEEYFQAKRKLFASLSPAGRKSRPKRALINADDPRAADVRQACRVPVWSYSMRAPADIRAEQVSLSLDGTNFVAVTPAGRVDIASRLVGEHNVHNMLAAIGVGLHEGVSLEAIRDGLQGVENVPGRFERVEAGQDFTVVVDYAHTEDALLRLLLAAQRIKTGRVLTVFGCGGDRDRGKRPKMGSVAARHSDVVFLTSDNPRTEDPSAILREVEAGLRGALDGAAARDFRYHVIPDRRRAIAEAVREAKSGDMVLIAGKGHEDYQILGTERHHFDDREEARVAIEALRK